MSDWTPEGKDDNNLEETYVGALEDMCGTDYYCRGAGMDAMG